MRKIKNHVTKGEMNYMMNIGGAQGVKALLPRLKISPWAGDLLRGGEKTHECCRRSGKGGGKGPGRTCLRKIRKVRGTISG